MPFDPDLYRKQAHGDRFCLLSLFVMAYISHLHGNPRATVLQIYTKHSTDDIISMQFLVWWIQTMALCNKRGTIKYKIEQLYLVLRAKVTINSFCDDGSVMYGGELVDRI